MPGHPFIPELEIHIYPLLVDVVVIDWMTDHEDPAGRIQGILRRR
jgi:hypothetical protein